VGSVKVPAGVRQLRVVLNGFAPTDVTPTGTLWFVDVWVW
jgi:hypothetical protein